MSARQSDFEDDPLWYKDAVIYQLHVKTFFDSNDDGVGDFRGLVEKLDYLEDLGVTAIWLLPFYPSPLKDDGYDIADYMTINGDYGTMRDFRSFMREAHRRGIRVITELVINHTSDQHQWFKRARKAREGSPFRDFYVWSDTPDRYRDARIIFLDFEPSNWAWDPVAKAYYWHRFYSHQPDLNFDNPEVHKALFKVMDFWFDMGVDGLRLDAVPYLYEREGTNCENLPETHGFLKKLRTFVDRKFRNRMLLAEANQWPEDAAEYFGSGDECHMAFHFPVMPRIFMALQMEDRFPIIDILDQTPQIPDACQWAMFLRNHDELTLEMVTDEERDYMYRVYASDPKARINLGIRRRLAPLVGNSRRKMELMNIILFSLPGAPTIYYGDEIGMGDNYYLGDRDGVRTPMQWSADRNAGFSRANPQKLYLPVIIDPEYHYEALNVENQGINPSSLLWWMKRIIAMRKKFKAFSRGSLDFVQSDNPKVISFIRKYEDEAILVVLNLSRFSQVVALSLDQFSGYIPEEVFSQNRFPPVKEGPYVLTLGFHDYFWFELKKEEEQSDLIEAILSLPDISVSGAWRNVFMDTLREKLQKEILPLYISGRRWFAGKARKLTKLRIQETVKVGGAEVLFVEAAYRDGTPDTYLLPVSHATGEFADSILQDFGHAAIARIESDGTDGILYDASYDPAFQKDLLSFIARKRSAKGRNGEIHGYPGKLFRSLLGDQGLDIGCQVLKADQSNTSFVYGNSLFLKLYRKVDEGMNPDMEITRFLTEKKPVAFIPPFGGAIEYQRKGRERVVLGQLQGMVPNEGDGWTFTLDQVSQYYERVLTKGGSTQDTGVPALDGICSGPVSDDMMELLGAFYVEMTSLLGQRTAELHRALVSSEDDPVFDPEPYSLLYQRSIFQSMRNLTMRTMQLLRANMRKLPDDMKEIASEVLGLEKDILERFKVIVGRKIEATKTRLHGDYHLGQVLFTGNNYVIIDFEGEPARSLSERRLKKSPLHDVAGMTRSFHYAAYTSLLRRGSVRPGDVPLLEPWADIWYCSISGVFIDSYLKHAGDASFIPADKNDIDALLSVFMLEKAIYELGYELNNRPDWIMIPIRGIFNVVNKQKKGG